MGINYYKNLSKLIKSDIITFKVMEDQMIYHIGDVPPFLVDERERGVLEVVHAIKFKGRDERGNHVYGHTSINERLVIGEDVGRNST